MGIEKDIQRLFSGVIERHGGNKAAAAASIDVNPVTFWHWVSQTRKFPSTLCKAIDSAGGRLLIPGEAPPVIPEQNSEIEALRKEIDFLTRENGLLRENVRLTKMVSEYEAGEEREKKKAPQASVSGRSAQPVGNEAGYGR